MLTSPHLELPGIRHGFFTRRGGVSRGVYAGLNCGLGSSDDRERILQNRAYVAGRLGVAASRLVTVHQAHTAVAHTVTAPFPPSEAPKADGLVTKVPGILLAITTADCTPILLADARARVIGAVHAGWRGALDGVLEATVEAMVGAGATRSAITAVIGPTIRQPSYEVGAEVRDAFVARSDAFARFFAPGASPSKFQFDLPGVVAARLASAGVGTVEDLGHDTYADDTLFFSYRRMTHRGEPDYGRHLHGIALV